MEVTMRVLTLVTALHVLRSSAAPEGPKPILTRVSETPKKPYPQKDYKCVTCSREYPVCEKALPKCDPNSPFRSIDGTCNNLINPGWGGANTMYARLLAPAYSDGASLPRGQHVLPPPRKISTTVNHNRNITADRSTHMLAAVGQFADHDVTEAPNSGLDCCGVDIGNPQCIKMEVPIDDSFYKTFNVTCLSFSRTWVFCLNETNGVAQQVNQATSFLDGSTVYSSNPKRAKLLRTYEGGRLIGNYYDPNLLPTKEDIERVHGKDSIDVVGEFVTGNSRGNQNPMLTSIQNLMRREHNRLAYEIEILRPRWNDEKIYQTARRILIAELQNVMYSEYLPQVLGSQVHHKYDLDIGQTFSRYSCTEDPSVFSDFAAGAERYGHSLVPGKVNMVRGNDVVVSFLMRDAFTNPEFIKFGQNQGYDLLLNGLYRQNAMSVDPYLAEDLTNFLFKKPQAKFGNDLAANDIMRGRDFGLQDYSAYREYCGLEKLRSCWDARPEEIPEDKWKQLKNAYKDPQDIDLISGGMSETPVCGGVVGPTFACLIGEQFRRLKSADRYFFTHINQKGSFTLAQVKKLSKVTLGDILCRNSDIKSTPLNVFRFPGMENPETYCSSKLRHYLSTKDFV